MLSARAPIRPLAERVAPFALLALALALRVREALRAPLWFDELYTRAAVERSWPELMRIVRADVHPPLYFALAWATRGAGASDFAVRSLAIACSLAAMGVGYVLARELAGRGAALLATMLLALQPWHVYLSQEARSYPLLGFGLAVSALGAWRWCERGRRADAALLVLGAATALWTHYLAGVLLAIQAAWGVARLAREPRRLARWAALHVLIVALFAPLLPLMLAQFRRIGGEHWLTPPGVAELLDVARRFAFGNVHLVPVVLGLALWPLGDPRARRSVSFALAIGPLAVLACWLLGRAGIRVFAFKYMMFALLPLYVVVAAGALRLPGRVTRALAALALVAFAARALAVQPPYPEAASFGVVRERLAPLARPGDVLFHSDTHTWLFGRRYFPALRHRLLSMGQRVPYYEGAAVVPDSARVDAGALREAGASGARWWALAWGKGGVDAIAFTACVDSFATAPAESCGIVRLWRCRPASEATPAR